MKFTDARIHRDFIQPFNIRLGKKSDQVQLAADAVRESWPDIVPDFSTKDGKACLRAMAIRHQANDWEGAKRSDVLIAARVAFSKEWIDDERLEPFRDFLIEQFELNDWAGLRRVMFSIHISSYSCEAEHTFGLVQAIEGCRDYLDITERQLLDSIPELLDPIAAPDRIAKRLMEEFSPQSALSQWGLKVKYDDGLMFLIHQSLCRFYEPLLERENDEYLVRFLNWLRIEGSSPLQRGAGLAIDAVLKPWAGKTPSVDYQASLISGLVDIYGDPRLNHSAAWAEASNVSVDTIRRWLTGETMLIFLKAISSTNDEGMWERRRDFWMGLYESGSIDEAWVAFSQEAYGAAQRMAKSDYEKRLHQSFGLQTASGRKTTSLLIMRIGNRVVVEGSHSYKVQLFEKSNHKIPRLYQQSYDCETIRFTSNSSKAHSGDAWQLWVKQKVL